MSIFEAVKQTVTTRQAAERYGIRVERNGMCRCPFHDDSTPSMKLDRRYYCFGCGANGNAIALPPPKRGLTDEQWADIAYCLRVLTDYLDLLHDWRERYKPASPEEPLDERFVEALHMTETIEHLTDCVAFGTPQQKAAAASQLLSGSFLLMLEERTDRLSLAKCA